MLNSKEQYKLEIIKSAISGKITNSEAGKIIGVSERQVQRLKNSVKKIGQDAVIHGLKNKVGNHSSVARFKDKVLNLIRTKYSDFKPSFASEKILEIEGLSVNPETLRLWMTEAGIWKARKKKGHKYFYSTPGVLFP